MITWREKQAARPDPISEALAAWNAAANDCDRTRMELAIFAAETADIIARECDEPGCDRDAMCGFPVEGGYRRTCSAHSDMPVSATQTGAEGT